MSLPGPRIVFVAAAIAALLAPPLGAAPLQSELTLVRGGAPQATIILAAQSTRVAEFAALELQHHVKLITGGTLPIARTGAAAGVSIFVGDSPGARAAGVHASELGFEEYVIRFVPNAIVLAGHDDPETGQIVYDMGDIARLEGCPDFWTEHGTLHAVYDFLERCCGVRWLNQTELGTVVPESPTLTVEPTAVKRAPAFRFRDALGARGGNPAMYDEYVSLWTKADPELEEWTNAAYPGLRAQYANDHELSRARGNMARLFALRRREGGEICRCNHSLYGYYQRYWEKSESQPELFVEQRPEMFAKGYDGKPPQMCYTSEALIKQLAQDARDYYDGKSTGAEQGIFWRPTLPNLFPVEPMDNRSFCKCEACQKLIAQSKEEGSHYSTGTHSNYFFHFVNAVADELNRTHPNARIVTLAYSSHAAPPDFELNPNIAVQFCFAANRSPASPEYAHEMKLLERWSTEGRKRPLYLWLYYTFPKERAVNGKYRCFPGFFAHTIGSQFRRFRKLGVLGMFHCGYGQEVEAYVTYRMMDDPTADVDELLDEWFAGLYGKAARPLKAMYLDIEKTYSDPALRPKERLSGPALNWGVLGAEERMTRYGVWVAKAKRLADTDFHRANVALWEKAVWDYMAKGRRQFVSRQRAPIPSLTAPKVASAGGDPDKVNWTAAASLGDKWYERGGDQPSARAFAGRIAHDGQHLYLELTDPCDTSKLEASAMVFPYDDWELFLANQRDLPYRQYAWGPTGLFKALSHGEINFRRNVPMEDPGARVSSDTSVPGKWISRVALPLDGALPGSVKPGDTIYMNLLRVTSPGIAHDGSRLGLDTWVSFCTVHEVDRLGAVTLAR